MQHARIVGKKLGRKGVEEGCGTKLYGIWHTKMKKEETSVASWRRKETRDERRGARGVERGARSEGQGARSERSEGREARGERRGAKRESGAEGKRKRGGKAYTYTRQEGSTSKGRGERGRIESERHPSWN